MNERYEKEFYGEDQTAPASKRKVSDMGTTKQQSAVIWLILTVFAVIATGACVYDLKTLEIDVRTLTDTVESIGNIEEMIIMYTGYEWDVRLKIKSTDGTFLIHKSGLTLNAAMAKVKKAYQIWQHMANWKAENI